MDPIKVDFSDSGKKKSVKEVLIPPEKAGLKIVINILITLVAAVVIYYFMLPPMNPRAYEFYLYFGAVFAVYIASAFVTSKAFAKPEYVPYARRQSIVPIALIAVLVLAVAVGYLISCPFFRAKAYSEILNLDTETELGDIINIIDDTEDSFSSVPRIDKASAQTLADKQLGDFVNKDQGFESQFELLADDSTQINFNNTPYRVYPLQYADLFKWFLNSVTNSKGYEGIPGYVRVNMVTQKAELVTDYDIKYSTAEHFNEYLARHLRFQYPTYLFGEISFEIDDSGKPYWIVERLDKKVGLFGGEDVIGILMVDAVTGDCIEYTSDQLGVGNTENADPSIQWIDQAFDADLLIKQYNYKGTYTGGFWNSLIGQTNVRKTSDGYTFLAVNDDVYLYTGVTSATVDNSILGFLLVNQRTKEAYFSRMENGGATELAAQGSAQGAVQDQGWKATFPLLLNLGGKPTYFMSLKDDSQLVKTYAMVSVEDFSVYAISPNKDADLGACLSAYIAVMAKNGKPININGDTDALNDPDVTGEDKPAVETQNVTGIIRDLKSQTVDGSTYYYISFDGEVYYCVAATLENNVVLFEVGDRVSVTAPAGVEGDLILASGAAFADKTPVTPAETPTDAADTAATEAE